MIYIEKYWSQFFNISSKELRYSKLSVIPHAELKGFNGAWIFKRNQTIIISVPQDLVPEITYKINNSNSWNDYFSQKFITYLFGNKVSKIIGPVFQGYYGKEVSESISDSVRPLDWIKDQKLILEIARSGDPTEWHHGSIDEKSSAIFGYMYDDRCVAIANYKLKLNLAGFIGVYTTPAFRGKGLGQEVVKAVVKEIGENGYVPFYQTLMENAPSVGIAQRLGIQKYAEHIAIRLT